MSNPKIVWSDDVDIDFYKPGYIAPKCVVGLDRDGVINVDIGDYVYKVDDWEFEEGSLEAIVKLRKLGHKIVIITNQGGIEKGIYTEEDVEKVHNHMFEELGKAGCPSIDGLYYSASSHKTDMYAKPNAGMFKRCEKEVPHVKFNKGYYAGDRLRDLKAAMKIGAIPVIIRTGHGKETEELVMKRFSYRDIKKKCLVFDNLAAFVDYLETAH
jgi:D-glycero-D-manno-heptose 1,7-bisphosphate phosphatase